MSQLFGWMATPTRADGSRVVAAMRHALGGGRDTCSAAWAEEGLAIGLVDATIGDVRVASAPAVSGDGRFVLWMAGEAFADGSGRLLLTHVDRSRTLAFRAALLDALLADGPRAIRDLDGEYQIAIWDRRDRVLTLLNDRFGGLPLYHARSRDGFAFAGGVRGVLVAPGVAADPDVEAIREAVSFGGFRLGGRTNVAAVKMVAGATCLTAGPSETRSARYWRWSDIAPQISSNDDAIVEEVHARWRTAVARRLVGASRPGQTLSGGLDSRAILAESAPRTSSWTAITFGVPECREVEIARRAARVAGAAWLFHPSYDERGEWLERRTARIQETDGLIDLADLIHVDTLPLQAAHLDVHLSGYVGDAVSGATFNHVHTAADVAVQMPFYGCEIGYDFARARALADGLIGDVAPAPARFAIFEHKLPQSTNRWTAAWRSSIRVRKPFVDYQFFDFCQGLRDEVRGRRLHERWLRTRYPSLFARLPNAKTGAPALAPRWREAWARITRRVYGRTRAGLHRVGIAARQWPTYHPDEFYWRQPAAHDRIASTILGPRSIAAGVFGRDAVSALIEAWRTRAAAPVQVIGALYAYECYHRDLAAHLRAAIESEPFAIASAR